MAEKISCEVVIVGAGPCGLFQVFELGLLGIHAHIVDSLKQPGGQCAELYPDKPIYDIPAIPECKASELIARLQQQIANFKPQMHLGQTVTELQKQDDGRFKLLTSAGTEFDTGAVILCAGVGAFQARRLNAPGAEEYEGGQLQYRVKEASIADGKDLVVLGGGDSALDWCLSLLPRTKSMTIIHRREEFRAAPASVAKVKQLHSEGKLRHMTGRVKKAFGQDGSLSGITIALPDKQTEDIACDQLLVFYGLAPKLGPIADWSLGLEKNQLVVDTEKFQTNVEGIFAVGDINTYPGKKKFILSGFHEAALAAFGVSAYLYPDKKQYVQYTTTSPEMHKRLGVESPKKN